MKWKRWVAKLLGFRLFDQHLCDATLTIERIRIWEEIFLNSSVEPYTEPTKSGVDKTTHIITIGEPKLGEIIFLPLSKDFPGVEKVLGFKVEVTNQHPSTMNGIERSKISFTKAEIV